MQNPGLISKSGATQMKRAPISVIGGAPREAARAMS